MQVLERNSNSYMDILKKANSKKHLFQEVRKRNPKKIEGRLSKNKSKNKSNKNT